MTDSEKIDAIMDKVNAMERMIFELKGAVTDEVIRMIAEEYKTYGQREKKV